MEEGLARVGVGNATVEVRLQSTTIRPGDAVDAEIRMIGGSAAREIDAVRLALETRYLTTGMHDDGYTVLALDRVTGAESVTIQPDETETWSVTVDVPYATPITRGGSDVWIDVTVDAGDLTDSEGTTDITVEPTPRLEAVLDVLDDLGFSLERSECLGDPDERYTTDRPYVQRFEFDPEGSRYEGTLDGIEVRTDPRVDDLAVVVDLDRHAGVLSELMGTDHESSTLVVDSTDRSEVQRQFVGAIENALSN